MKDITIAIFNAAARIGITYLICAAFVGGDTLVPHKYVIYKDGTKYVTNKNPIKTNE